MEIDFDPLEGELAGLCLHLGDGIVPIEGIGILWLLLVTRDRYGERSDTEQKRVDHFS